MLFSFAAIFVAPTLATSNPTQLLSIERDAETVTVFAASGDILSRDCPARYKIGKSATNSACGSQCSYFLPDQILVFASEQSPFDHGLYGSMKMQVEHPFLRPPIT